MTTTLIHIDEDGELWELPEGSDPTGCWWMADDGSMFHNDLRSFEWQRDPFIDELEIQAQMGATSAYEKSLAIRLK